MTTTPTTPMTATGHACTLRIGQRNRRNRNRSSSDGVRRRSPTSLNGNMLEHQASSLGREWTTLQDNFEQYERSSLLIKLGSIALLVACMAMQLDAVATCVLILVMWVQEGIFRTFQSRLGQRILRIEGLLRQAATEISFSYQLHSEWQASRHGYGGLVAEYGKSMVRPTVAFPHLVLILIVIVWPVPG